MTTVKHIDGDVSDAYAQRYRDKMPFDVVGVYNPQSLECNFGSAGKRGNRKHIYVVVASRYNAPPDDFEFYVGITGRPPVKRWKEHIGIGAYSGAEFLEGKEILAFILVKQRAKNAEEIEDKITLQLMVKYGVENVSGGRYAVDREPGTDLPLLRNPDEYDYLRDVDEIESEAIPKSEAHQSVVNSPMDRVITLIMGIIMAPFGLIYVLYRLALAGIALFVGIWLVVGVLIVIATIIWIIWQLLPF